MKGRLKVRRVLVVVVVVVMVVIGVVAEVRGRDGDVRERIYE